MPDITSSDVLITYGPLGIGWALTVGALVKVYSDLKAERAARAADNRASAEERSKLEERMVAKADTWIDKYQAIATPMIAAIDSATKRRGP